MEGLGILRVLILDATSGLNTLWSHPLKVKRNDTDERAHSPACVKSVASPETSVIGHPSHKVLVRRMLSDAFG